ncbi:EamA family transporter, partial [Candidatus Woesearchaeota archaeon]|nr:EamA family transporter [Candidatus Woesearchaeota archaeon]
MALNPYLETILAGIIWGSSGIFVKYLNLPSTTVTFFRLAIPTLILLLFFIIKKIELFQGNNKLILLASTLNAGRVYLYTVGFTFASIGNAIIVLYTWPVFTTVFGILFLKEKVSKRTFFLLFLALMGTALIYFNKEFSFSDKNFIGMTAMLFSAVIYAFTVIIFKKESEKYSKYETIFYQNIIGSLIFIPFILINKPLPTISQASIGIVYGALIGLVGFVFFFSALKRLKASTVSFLSYAEVISAI